MLLGNGGEFPHAGGVMRKLAYLGVLCALAFGCGDDDMSADDGGGADALSVDGGSLDGGTDAPAPLDAGGFDVPTDVPMDTPPDIPMDAPCGDMDGDGITDVFEGDVDTDMDGTPDAEDDDSDGDGISDADEFGGMTCMAPVDSDGDGTADFRDTDSDENGIPDETEGSDDGDMDGAPDFRDDDNDGDGLTDVVELAGSPDTPPDFDGDETPDYLDTDSDNDTIADVHEADADSDMDMTPDRFEIDSDGDGISDADEAGDADESTIPVDSDFDLIPDFQDLDSDGDGLSDEEEVAGGTDPTLTDSDMDGASDLVEVAAGTDPNNGADNPRASGDFVFVMYFGQDPEPGRDVLDFATDIQVSDVYFLMDTTGSMGGSITALRAALADTLIPGIRAEIPDTWFGVGEFRDYGFSPYGSSGDQPYTHFQDMTGNDALAQAATGRYTPRGGNDSPESHGQALWSMATGNGLPRSTVGARVGCPADTFGYPCFRNTAVPIVVMITDIRWHNGPGNSDPYSGIAGEPQYADAVTVINDNNIRFIGIGQGSGGLANMNQFGRDVGSVDSGGAPFVSTYASAAALTTTIIDQIRTLIATPIDVSTRFIDDPSDAVDTETAFLDRIEANEAGDPARMCAPRMGEDTDADGFPDVFRAVPPGERVCFDLVVGTNNTVEQTGEPQLFRATIEVLGDGFTPLDSRDVYFLVPPTIGL